MAGRLHTAAKAAITNTFAVVGILQIVVRPKTEQYVGNLEGRFGTQVASRPQRNDRKRLYLPLPFEVQDSPY
jgi:hypothetical protein